MGSPFDRLWVEEVCSACDPIFDSAQVGVVRQVQYATSGEVAALLWEANPLEFAARYPDSGVVDSYGADQWPGVRCIDYWVYIDHDRRRCRISVEGLNLPDLIVEHDNGFDGMALADTFARILGVASPRT